MRTAIIFAALFLTAVSPALAQTPTGSASSSTLGAATLGVGRLVATAEKDVKDGALLSSSDHGAVPSATPYDSQVLGVVSRDAAIVINSGSSTPDDLPVISYGQVYMLVSTKSGAIKKGDLLTTSTIPGVGVKATKSGYVLGTALEDYDSSDPEAVEKIAIDLNLHYFNSKSPFPGSLTDIFKIAILPTKEGPNAIFKYIVAALVAIGSLVLGFMTLGQPAAKGVEALGRNPAASRIIHLGIVLNVTIVVTIVLAGLTVAFLILRL